MYSFYEKSVGGIPNHCSTSITRLCLFLSSLIEFSLLTLKIYCYRLKEHYCTIFIFKKNAATCMSTGSLHYSCRKFSFFFIHDNKQCNNYQWKYITGDSFWFFGLNIGEHENFWLWRTCGRESFSFRRHEFDLKLFLDQNCKIRSSELESIDSWTMDTFIFFFFEKGNIKLDCRWI